MPAWVEAIRQKSRALPPARAAGETPVICLVPEKQGGRASRRPALRADSGREEGQDERHALQETQ